MEVDKFLQQLDKEIPAVVLLIGDEDYYIDKIVAKIKKKWLGDNVDAQYTVLNTEPEAIMFNDILHESSFFSDTSLVVVEQSKLFGTSKQGETTSKNKDSYLEILNNVPDFCKVIIKSEKVDKRTKLYKSFSAIGQIVECEKMKNYKVKNWLIRVAEDYGCKWQPQALDFLVNYLSMLENVSLYLLAQEVEKISLYTSGKTIWNKEDVEAVFSDLTELSSFVLIKAMADGDANKALTILKEQTLRGEHMLKISGLVAFQLRRLLLVKNILNNGSSKEMIIAQAKIPPFIADELIRQCDALPEKKIKRALEALSEISREIHLGGRGIVHLEEMIVEFCVR